LAEFTQNSVDSGIRIATTGGDAALVSLQDFQIGLGDC